MKALMKCVEYTCNWHYKLLLPVTLLLICSGFLHLVWFPRIYTDDLRDSQRVETGYLRAVGAQLEPLLEAGDVRSVKSALQKTLQEKANWMTLELDGDIRDAAFVSRKSRSIGDTLTHISIPVATADHAPLTLTAGVDLEQPLTKNMRRMQTLEMILALLFALTALSWYFVYEHWVRRPLYALLNSAEQVLGKMSIPIHTLAGSELGKLTRAFEVMHEELGKTRELVDVRHKILEIIRDSQLNFIRDEQPALVFKRLLTGLLDLTGSEYGFMGEVLYTKDGARYLEVITAAGHVDESLAISPGACISDPDTLVGKVINTGDTLIFNHKMKAGIACRPDESTPAPDSFLGVPFMRGQKVIGMFGITNRKSGYDNELIQLLQPLTSTCTGLIEATKNERERQRVANELGDKIEYIKAIVDTVVDGIITIDELGIILSLNPAAERIFGYSAEEVTGKNVSILMPEPYRSAHDKYLSSYKNTGERKIIGIDRELEGQRKDGSVFPMDLAVSEMFTSGCKMFAGVVRDITERRESERIKDEFISVVSHELRTPLTSVHGSLALMAGGMVGKLPVKCQELVRMANTNVERLVRMINNLLDIEKMEAGKFCYEYSVTDMKDVITYAVRESSGYMQKYDVAIAPLELPDNVCANIDHDRIVQVIINLISNAAKYSKPGDRIGISMEADSDWLRVSVTDHGAGIPEEFHSSVFKKFWQSDSSDSRKRGGTGLGLSICKSIIDGHGGHIGFDTLPGVGTTFYFELPLANPAADPLQKRKRQRQDKLCVLICEDDDDIAVLCEFLLRNAGFDVEQAESIATARELLDSQHFDTVILDIGLPDGDGMQIVRELDADGSTIPVIVVSASASSVRNEYADKQTCVVNWIDKPVDQQTLISAVLMSVQVPALTGRRLLHVDDDEDIIELVQNMLDETWEAIPAKSLAQARALLSESYYDLVILDIGLPDGSGLDLLAEIRELGYPVILFSEEDSIESTIHDFEAKLVKSYTSSAKLLKTLLDLTDAA